MRTYLFCILIAFAVSAVGSLDRTKALMVEQEALLLEIEAALDAPVREGVRR